MFEKIVSPILRDASFIDDAERLKRIANACESMLNGKQTLVTGLGDVLGLYSRTQALRENEHFMRLEKIVTALQSQFAHIPYERLRTVQRNGFLQNDYRLQRHDASENVVATNQEEFNADSPEDWETYLGKDEVNLKPVLQKMVDLIGNNCDPSKGTA